MQGYKTVIFGMAVMLLGILQSTEVTTLVAQYPGPVMTIVGLITVVLRAITTTPLFTPTSTNKE